MIEYYTFFIGIIIGIALEATRKRIKELRVVEGEKTK